MAGITSGLIDRTLRVGDCVLTATRHQPLFQLKPHDHEHPNINIVAEGHLEETVERTAFSCRGFSSMLKPAGAKHSNRYGSKETHCLIVEFMPQFVMGRQHGRALSEVRYSESPGSRTLASRIWSEFCTLDSAAPLIIEGLVLELLGLKDRATRLSGTVPRWLERCREILESNLRHPASISELSQLLGIDRSHLTKEFKRRYGLPPGAYVRHKRLALARELLRTTHKPISEVAQELGFYDQSHFSRLFAAETGTTPLEFRRCSAPQKSLIHTPVQD
jgi:AraC family transcriptional regulator